MQSNDDVAIPIPFCRWYDRDLHLSELVKALEPLSDDSKTLFAFLVNFFSDEIVKVKGRLFFKELEWDKVLGVYKSRINGRRWYDREPLLQKAFNKMYSLNEHDKCLIARALVVPGQLVSAYESHCVARNKSVEQKTIQAIVESCFKDGPEKAQKTFSIFSKQDD